MLSRVVVGMDWPRAVGVGQYWGNLIFIPIENRDESRIVPHHRTTVVGDGLALARMRKGGIISPKAT